MSSSHKKNDKRPWPPVYSSYSRSDTKTSRSAEPSTLDNKHSLVDEDENEIDKLESAIRSTLSRANARRNIVTSNTPTPNRGDKLPLVEKKREDKLVSTSREKDDKRPTPTVTSTFNESGARLWQSAMLSNGDKLYLVAKKGRQHFFDYRYTLWKNGTKNGYST